MATRSVSIRMVIGGRLSCGGRPCAAASVESTIRNAAMMKNDFMAASLYYRFCTRILDSIMKHQLKYAMAICLLLLAQAGAQTTTGTVKGKVKEQNGKALEGVLVRATSAVDKAQ